MSNTVTVLKGQPYPRAVTQIVHDALTRAMFRTQDQHPEEGGFYYDFFDGQSLETVHAACVLEAAAYLHGRELTPCYVRTMQQKDFQRKNGLKKGQSPTILTVAARVTELTHRLDEMDKKIFTALEALGLNDPDTDTEVA